VTVNGEEVALDAVVKDNDVICHRVHRHEPPVTATPIEILVSNDDIVVVNKPSSIPVHPCGRYRHNSVVFLLGREHGLKNLHTVHRIDRLTSGILMFAKSASKARKLESEIRGREVLKEYVCRVEGEFPSELVECNEPILVVSHKIGICRVSPDGKPCHTDFCRISTNKQTSIVRCIPHTGRMHQIRVHLQWLGRMHVTLSLHI
jgi:RluA family pseudouridine synthase